MTITELAIKRPTLIIVIFIALTILGVFGYQQLKYELLPDISIPVISVITVYPGASPREVENGVTKKIEDALSGLDQVDGVYSTSQENVSSVIVEFKQGVNLNNSLQDAQRKLSEITASLPSGAKPPSLSKISVNDQPVLRMGVTGNQTSTAFFQFVKDQIQPRLSRIAGVGQVTLVGGNEREIKVNVDVEKIRAYGVSVVQVLQAVKASNLDFPTGSVKDSDGQFVVRLAGKIGSLEELKALIVGKSRQGGDIRLADVAEVQDGRKDVTTISRINGKEAIGLLIQKQSDANAVDVSRLVREEVTKLENEYAQNDLKFDIAQDSSIFTLASANAVKEDLGIAILLVALVMLVFLHSIRNSLIVMIAIPTSLISTFIGMWAFGFTLNIVTLLALSLVIGILVDDSIVVLENIYRHLEMGKNKREAALVGRNEIGFTAMSITLVDVVVFVPLALVTGTIGGVMREFSIVVVVSTLMSLFVSFTVTPVLASRFSKLEQLTRGTLMGRFGNWFERVYQGITDSYAGLLKQSLKPSGMVVVIVAAVLLFAGALLLVLIPGFIGSEFIPQTDRGEFQISVELPPGATLDQTNFAVQKIERMLTEIPEVEKVFVNIGTVNGMVSSSSNNIAELNVSLVPREERPRKPTGEMMQAIKEKLALMPGVKTRVNSIAIWGTSEMTPIQLYIAGSNWNEVYKSAVKIKKIIEKIPGTEDVRLSAEEGKPETRIEIDREKMAALGLTVADVGSALRVGLTGDDDSTFRDTDGTEYKTRIVFDESDRSKTSEVANLTVANRLGMPVELKQFTRIYQTLGPTRLQRRDRNYSVTVSSQAAGRPSGDIGQDISKLLAKETFPPGISYDFGGDIEQQRNSFISLAIALIAAIVFVYLIMAALYESFIYPFIVLFSVPLAIIGALVALALTMNSLNIMSILGIIMQIGLVSKNAILLVDFANRARAEGFGTREALIEAGRERLRPILMTTMTMILGMLPIALSTSPGSEFKHGLGWALIGGLTCSMFMTLIVVPVAYVAINRIREYFLGLGRKIIGKTEVREA